jgi:NitT/TauT family transport system ATP-binding protein
MTALAFEDITLRFGAAEVVGGASFSVAEGEFVSVVGPTGCGKSTLLNLAAGLLAPTTGRVLVNGRPLAGLNRHAGYLFQSESLMPWRSARDNVAAGPEFAGKARDEVRTAAETWLARVGLSGHGDKYPHQMSGGMRKRAQLAQTLVLDPPILLMDEPFSALDVQTRQMMENELLTIWQADKKSVLFITHDLEEAISLSDRVIVLSAGPATRPIAEFAIDLPRPRDVAEIRLTEAFRLTEERIWSVLRDEVLKAYRAGAAA